MAAKKNLVKVYKGMSKREKGVVAFPSDMTPCSLQDTIPSFCWDKMPPPLKHLFLCACVIQKKKKKAIIIRKEDMSGRILEM